jgi:hypothetical protein
MPKDELGTALGRDGQGDPEIVLRDEVSDTPLQIRQDGKRWGLHATKAPGLSERGRPEPQRDGAGTVEAQVIVLILAAESLEVGGIVALARVRLFGKGRKGPSDRDLVEGAQLETVHPTPKAKVLEHLPGNHRAFPARVGGDDDPLHPFQCLLDRIHLRLMGLAGAAGAVGDRNALKHDRERIKAPGLPFVPHVAGLFGCEEVALGGDADRRR